MTLESIIRSTKKNIIIHGRAGSGKSFLIREFQRAHPNECLILSPLARCAHAVGGVTVASILFRNTIEDLILLFSTCSFLIIDEVSMVKSIDLELIFNALCNFKFMCPHKKSPRLILIGDPFQLPPVVPTQEIEAVGTAKGKSMSFSDFYFFNSESFKLFIDFYEFEYFHLDTAYRHQNDHSGLINILDDISQGNLTYEALNRLNDRVGQFNISKREEESIPWITSTKNDAMFINDRLLNIYHSSYFVSRPVICQTYDSSSVYKSIIESDPLSESIKMATGMPVIFTRNDVQKRWDNGLQGNIINIKTTSDGPSKVLVKLLSGKVICVRKKKYDVVIPYYDPRSKNVEYRTIAEITQFPFMAGYACTIHKAQGLTMEKVIVSLGFGTFTPGQLYVALSRTRSLDGLYIKTPIKQSDLIISKDVQCYWHQFLKKAITVR